jgi:hypothetical protein
MKELTGSIRVMDLRILRYFADNAKAIIQTIVQPNDMILSLIIRLLISQSFLHDHSKFKDNLAALDCLQKIKNI